MNRLVAVMLLAAMGTGCSIALPTRATPREPLDALWDRRMLEGRGVQMWLDENWQPNTVIEGRSFGELQGRASRNALRLYTGSNDPYKIFVRRHVEGYWRNGGWTLVGGLLGVVSDAEFTIELFGKAIIRAPVHIPAGIFHLDSPTETGYEFFLLRRSHGTGIAVIIRRWVVQSADVDKGQHRYPAAGAVLTYDASTHIAEVSITGLKQPVKDRVDVSSSRMGR